MSCILQSTVIGGEKESRRHMGTDREKFEAFEQATVVWTFLRSGVTICREVLLLHVFRLSTSFKEKLSDYLKIFII